MQASCEKFAPHGATARPPLGGKTICRWSDSHPRAAMHPCRICFAIILIQKPSISSRVGPYVNSFTRTPGAKLATLLRFAGEGLGPSSIPGACNFKGAKTKQHGTRDSQMITQFTTNRAQTSLACLIGREGAFSGWYDRAMPFSSLLQFISQ